MGINGLLQQLKSISRPTHVSSYRGQKVAIDGYSWLHKGAYSCSRELCEGIWADGYTRYFISRIDMLLGNGVIPIVVFDGCRLPMKADEEDSRRRSRREALERARTHSASGNMAAATECYQRAVDIAPWMAKVVMEALRERQVTCLVAPYEADAQMSYLALRGDVHAVLTEDSDMLAYGCPRVLYKLDRGGSGEEVMLSDLPLVREINMAGFNHDMLLQMCILAGCDFLPNIPGVGIKKAHAMIRKHRDFVKVVRNLHFNGTSPPPGYEIRFQRTLWLFRHQRVFCPIARALTHLRPLPPGGLGAADVLVLAALPPEGPEREALHFLGPPMAAEVATGIAMGELDPSTLQPFDLPTIYRGCAHPPRHLRPLLHPPPPIPPSSGSASQHQQRGPSQGHGGASGPGAGSQGGDRVSWGIPPGPGQQSQSHGHCIHPNNHNRQQHLSQQQARLGRHSAGSNKPPIPPNGRIDRYFFAPNPAASQPFRHHVQLGGGVNVEGKGAQRLGQGAGGGGDDGGGERCGGSGLQVVSLGGAAGDAAQEGATAGAAAAATATATAATSAADELVDGGRGGPVGAGGGGEDVRQDAEEDTGCSPPSAKRRRFGRHPAPAPAPAAASAGGSGVGSDSLFSRFRHCSSVAAARGRGGSGAEGSRAADGLMPSQPESQDRIPSRAECRTAAVDGPGGGGATGSQGSGRGGVMTAVAVAGLGEEVSAAAGPLGSAPGSQRTGPSSQGHTRGWCSGADSDLLDHPPSGTATRDGSQYGSQYDSQYDGQVTSGCEGAGWGTAWRAAGGSGSGGGGSQMAGRSRAPARLAMEALFSEPSGGSGHRPQSQPALHAASGGGTTGSGPTASAGTTCGSIGGFGAGRQVLGALAAFHCWRQMSGPVVLGGAAAAAAVAVATAGGGEQPVGSVGPDTDFQTRTTTSGPNPLARYGQGDAAGVTDAPGFVSVGLRAGSGASAAAPAVSTPAVGGSSRVRKPLPKPPPQFSIYDLDMEGQGDPHAVPDRAAVEYPIASIQCAGGGGSVAALSPWKHEEELGASPPRLPRAALPGHKRACGAVQQHHGNEEVSDGNEEEDGGEAEVTSPLKLASFPQLPPHRTAPSIRRLFPAIKAHAGASLAAAAAPAPPRQRLPRLLHPSARRRFCGDGSGQLRQQQEQQRLPEEGGMAGIGGHGSPMLEAHPLPPSSLQAEAASGPGQLDSVAGCPGLEDIRFGPAGGSEGFRLACRSAHQLLQDGDGGEEEEDEELQVNSRMHVETRSRAEGEGRGTSLGALGVRLGAFDDSQGTCGMMADLDGGTWKPVALHGCSDGTRVGGAGRGPGTREEGEGACLGGGLRAEDASENQGDGGADGETGDDGSDDPEVAEFTRALERSEARWRDRRRRQRPPNTARARAYCTQAFKASNNRLIKAADTADTDVAAGQGSMGHGGVDAAAAAEEEFGVLERGGAGVCLESPSLDNTDTGPAAAAAAAGTPAPDPRQAAGGFPELARGHAWDPQRRDVIAHHLGDQQHHGSDSHDHDHQHQEQEQPEGLKQPWLPDNSGVRGTADAGAELRGPGDGDDDAQAAGTAVMGYAGGGGGGVADGADYSGDDEVQVTADVRANGSAAASGDGFSAGFHSLKHVAHFAAVAKRALDSLECSLAVQQPVIARRLSPLPSQALQQRGRGGSLDSGAGAVGKLSAAAAAAAPAVRPLADFAFIRSAPKRRVSAGRTGMLVNTPSAPTGPMGRCRPSVFVQPADEAAAPTDADEALLDGNGPTPPLLRPRAATPELENKRGGSVDAQAPPGHTSRIDGGDADGSREGIEPSDGDSDDGSDEVVIVGEAPGKGSWHFGSLPRNGGGDAGSDRQTWADTMLRRPFQPPRTNAGAFAGAAAAAASAAAAAAVTSSQAGAGTVRRTAQAPSRRAKSSLGVRNHARGPSQPHSQQQPQQQQQQQQRITAFGRFAFSNGK